MSIIRQILVGRDNFSYIITSGTEAALVDPGADASEVLGIIKEEKLELLYAIQTHHHRDHTQDMGRVKKETDCLTVAHKNHREADKIVEDGDTIELGQTRIEIIHTPGHTPDGICLLVDHKCLLTGDTLFIHNCGRTDLPGGSNREMWDSLQRIKDLDGGITIYPGHHYGSIPKDTLENQKRVNPVLLAQSFEEFLMIP